MIRTLICDDALAFSTLVRHWLSNCPDLEVVGTVGSGQAAIRAVGELEPDVILLDHVLYDMPGGSGQLAPLLRERHPGLAIVLVSGMPDDQLAALARQCGADGFVSKATKPEALCDAVRRAAAPTRRFRRGSLAAQPH